MKYDFKETWRKSYEGSLLQRMNCPHSFHYSLHQPIIAEIHHPNTLQLLIILKNFQSFWYAQL